MAETRQTTLNGGKPRPLSAHAMEVLQSMKGRPIPRQEINPGVIARLQCEEPPVVEIVQHPSPYAKHKGGLIDHVALTAAGRKLTEPAR